MLRFVSLRKRRRSHGYCSKSLTRKIKIEVLRRTGALVERRARWKSFLAYRHQHCRGEQNAKRLEAGIDLAESHAQQCADDGGGTDQEGHGRVPAVDPWDGLPVNGRSGSTIPAGESPDREEGTAQWR
jgi:hypothetical protein